MSNQSGKVFPIGDGAGATDERGSSGGGHDFVASPTSNSGGGGHDFVANPSSPATGPKPTDFAAQKCPPQPNGADPNINPQSVPAGGRLPYKGAPKPLESGGKPFKV